LIFFEITESFADIYSKLSKGYSKIPVYRDSIDHIKGVFVLFKSRHLDEKDFAWNFNTKPFFIPENKKLDNNKSFQK
jgi:Mg2+/Co2+ transporter CorB